MPGGWEWAILLVVVLLLFGAKRLPEMARALGQSARVLKGEMKGMKSDDAAREHPEEPSARARPAALPPGESSASLPVTAAERPDGQRADDAR